MLVGGAHAGIMWTLISLRGIIVGCHAEQFFAARSAGAKVIATMLKRREEGISFDLQVRPVHRLRVF